MATEADLPALLALIAERAGAVVGTVDCAVLPNLTRAAGYRAYL